MTAFVERYNTTFEKLGYHTPIEAREAHDGVALTCVQRSTTPYRTDLVQRSLHSVRIQWRSIHEHHLVLEHPITVQQRQGGTSTINTLTAFETVMAILSIITLFNPMRIFLPLSLTSLTAGLVWGVPIVLRGRGVSVGAMLAFTTGVLFFALGLIAEQLATIRKSRT